MAKNKHYVVWAGRQSGIYSSWKECSVQVTGYKYAKYKSFRELNDAINAYSMGHEIYYSSLDNDVNSDVKHIQTTHETLLSTNRRKDIFLYLLQLNENKYYVGQSIYPEKRIASHFKGKGASWTRINAPVRIIKCWNTHRQDWKNVEMMENIETLKLMEKFGWKNVRGGFWSDVDELCVCKNILHHDKLIKSLGFSINCT